MELDWGMTADTLLDATDEDEKPVNDYDQSLPVILRYRKAIARVWGLATCVGKLVTCQ